MSLFNVHAPKDGEQRGPDEKNDGCMQSSKSSLPASVLGFSPDQWEKLCNIQNRSHKDIHNRKRLIYDAVEEQIGSEPVASLLADPMQGRFFTALNEAIKSTNQDGRLTRYMQCLMEMVFDKNDTVWLASQIEVRKGVEEPSLETKLLRQAVHSVLESDVALCEKLLRAAGYLDQNYFTTPPENLKDLLDGYFSHRHPLLCFRRTVSELAVRGIVPKPVTAKVNLIKCRDLFQIASFPDSDKQTMSRSVDRALRPESGAPSEGPKSLGTADKSAAEALLKNAWMQRAATRPNFDISQLFNLDQPALPRQVCMLSQPTVPSASTPIADWYATCCLQELVWRTGNIPDPVKTLNKTIKQYVEQGRVVAMFTTNDQHDTIAELGKSFPQLILVVLSQSDAMRYSDIVSENSIFDGHIRSFWPAGRSNK
jgi:hypothetical protein